MRVVQQFASSKKTPFDYNVIVQVALQKEKVILWQIKQILYRTQNGCANTTLCLLQSIDDKINTKKVSARL